MERKVNDVHVHLGKSSIINNWLSEDDILNFREKNNIDNFFLMSLDLGIEHNNKKIIELSHKYNFVHGMYWIRNSTLKQDLSILNKELGNGIVGVKFHGVFEKLPVVSEVYRPVMELLNDKQALLLVHCGRYKEGGPESHSSYIHALEVAKKYPKIKVILAHMGGNDTNVVKKAVNAATDIPNAFLDTSGISTPYRVEYAVDILGAERILFGSDFPWCSIRSMYYGVEDALIDEHLKELIMSKNFFEILKQ